MGKYLFTADIHVTDRPRDEYRWEIFPWLRTQVQNRGIDALFILGDLTDQKDKHSAHLVNRLVEQIEMLANFTYVVIIMGNHDYVDPATPFFGFLGKLDDVWFNSLVGLWHDQEDFLLLPHTKQPKKEWKACDFNEYDFILTHQTYDGSVASNGFEMEGVLPSVFGDTDAKIISGDIHVPQKVGQVTYCGSPHPIAFGDDFQPRVLFWDGSKMKSIKRTTLKKAILRITDPDQLSAQDVTEGDQVKVVVSLPRSRFCDWDAIRTDVTTRCIELGLVLAGVDLRELGSGQTASEPFALPRDGVRRRPREVFHSFCDTHEIDGALEAVGEQHVG